MAKMSCFPALLAGRRKKHRKVADATKAADCPKVKPVEFIQAPLADVAVAVEPRDAKVPVPVATPPKGSDHEGQDQMASDDTSDLEFEFHAAKKPVGSEDDGGCGKMGESPAEQDTPPEPTDATQKLKRSCSNIETKRPGPQRDDATAAVSPPARRSRSYGNLTDLTPAGFGAPDPEASPASVKTSRTADRVMLKKRSSSQVLPSRSRKLWWRLFLWSHRNLHRPQSSARASASAAAACSAGRHGGYTSDTHEEGGPADDHRKDKMAMADGSTPPAVPNQWVAFCAENSLHDRVSAWVSSIETEPPFGIAEVDDEVDADDNEEGACTARHRALKLGEPSSSGMKGHGRSKRCAAADEASSVVQSLNAFSMVAHISGMGLKVVPMIAPFSSLRAVNLSGNFIVHISPGSLPKGLHSLDLSRNKIAAIEGLRELTKLRVLNLCYNRISRIGHGLSNGTAIRELYLAGNKISDVEGLHRLLKLAVLDLSFNKITTAKALGQLVANYHSLLALNLVGNPVQTNIGDDALRRAVTGLLPGLAYLNKQPVKPQRSAREVATDSVARAALGGGGGGRSQRRRASRRMGAGAVVDGGGRSRSRGRHHGSGSGSTKK